MIIATDPEEARKAAAFVEALARLEESFGYRLSVGSAADAASGHFEPVTFGDRDSFVVLRAPGAEEKPGSLALGFNTDT